MAVKALGVPFDWEAIDVGPDGMAAGDLTNIIATQLGADVTPLAFNFSETSIPPSDVIYPYVESGFPVILSTHPRLKTKQGWRRRDGPAHAYLIVGHGHLAQLIADAPLPETRNPIKRLAFWIQRAAIVDYLPASRWVPSYIVHDDKRGPFLAISSDFVSANSIWAVVLIPAAIQLKSPLLTFEAKATSRAYGPDTSESLALRRLGTRVEDSIERRQLTVRSLVVESREWLAQSRAAQLWSTTARPTELPDRIVLVEIGTPDVKRVGRHYAEFIFDPADRGLTPIFTWIHGLYHETHRESTTEIPGDYPQLAFRRPSFASLHQRYTP